MNFGIFCFSNIGDFFLLANYIYYENSDLCKSDIILLKLDVFNTKDTA